MGVFTSAQLRLTDNNFTVRQLVAPRESHSYEARAHYAILNSVVVFL